MEACFGSGWKRWIKDSSPVTIHLMKSSPSAWSPPPLHEVLHGQAYSVHFFFRQKTGVEPTVRKIYRIVTVHEWCYNQFQERTHTTSSIDTTWVSTGHLFHSLFCGFGCILPGTSLTLLVSDASSSGSSCTQLFSTYTFHCTPQAFLYVLPLCVVLCFTEDVQYVQVTCSQN